MNIFEQLGMLFWSSPRNLDEHIAIVSEIKTALAANYMSSQIQTNLAMKCQATLSFP